MLHCITKEVIVNYDRSVKLLLAMVGTDDPAVAMQGHVSLRTNDSGRHPEQELYPAIDARVLVGSKKHAARGDVFRSRIVLAFLGDDPDRQGQRKPNRAPYLRALRMLGIGDDLNGRIHARFISSKK